VATGGDARARGGEAARAAKERSGCGGAGGGAAAQEQHRRETARRRLGFGGGGLKRRRPKNGSGVRLRRGRSAFNAMIGRAGRLIGRGGAASSQSPVSSWRDRTRPVRDDRTLTESGQRLPGNLTRMTGRDGGVQDRTQWSQRHV
jgi:hypothetical protein